MMSRILVAIDDSRPAMAAGVYAIQLAVHEGAEIHFVAVAEPAHTNRHALRHIANLAIESGLIATTTNRDGRAPFEVLLTLADEWNADLIVMGRSDERRPGAPRVGSQTEHLLEFAHVPVLVIPPTRPK